MLVNVKQANRLTHYSPLYRPNRKLLYYMSFTRKYWSALAVQRVLHWKFAGGRT